MNKDTGNILRVSEIFVSFQGESTFMGRPTIFIRLAGCNLRCRSCDTKYAFDAHKTVGVSKIIQMIKPFTTPYVCITGGEPLGQKPVVNKLIKSLIKGKKIVSVETNGSISIKGIPKVVKSVVDVKTPSSGEQKSFCLKNLKLITPNDEIKFVISDFNDFKFSINFIKKHRLQQKPTIILFSPNLRTRGLAKKLVGWILKSKLNIIFQPQLHKLIKEKPVYIFK